MYPYEKKYDHVVKIEKDKYIATITFDCPENNNRVTEQQIDEFGAALDNSHWIMTCGLSFSEVPERSPLVRET